MAEDTLREGLALGEASKMGSEAEGLGHWQVGSHDAHGSACNLFFFIHNTSPLVQTVVHSSHGVLGGSDFTLENGFLEGGFSSQLRSIETPYGSLDQLASSSVDGIGM